jgi:hypothetical protein
MRRAGDEQRHPILRMLLQSAEPLLDGRLLLLRVDAIVLAEAPMTITFSFSFDSQEGSSAGAPCTVTWLS